jgi:hypothetical protein
LGKNEVIALIDREKKINDELKKIKRTSSNVLDMRGIALLNEMKKIQAKLKVLRPDSDDIA